MFRKTTVQPWLDFVLPNRPTFRLLGIFLGWGGEQAAVGVNPANPPDSSSNPVLFFLFGVVTIGNYSTLLSTIV